MTWDYALDPHGIQALCRDCGGLGSISFAGVTIEQGTCTCGNVLELEFVLSELSERIQGETYDLLGVPWPNRSQS